MASNCSSGKASRTRISGPLSSCEVEGVQRLAAFHHHVVGDVDHVVDHGDADGPQPIGQPSGTGADLDAADHAGRIAIAQIRDSRSLLWSAWRSGGLSVGG